MTATGTEDYVTEYNYNNSTGDYTALLQKEVKTVENEADESLITLNSASNVKQTIYTYDANGNQITKTSDGKTETNAYDSLNQLIGFNDGETTASYKYDAFGVEKDIVDSDTNAFRYCGEYFDTETGTVYLRARYYNPTTGRFISRDSFAGRRSDPLSLNLYTYCGNNPVLFTDPLGHDYYYFYGNDQAEAADVNINELEEKGEIVHSYPIESEEDFTENWNNMNTTENDSIIINMHGSTNSVTNMNLIDMDKKTANYLYLLSCNAGNQETGICFAERMFNKNSISCLIACDGTNYRPIKSETKKKSWDIFGWFEKTVKYVDLSVARDKVEIGPQKYTMGYVAYTKGSFGENKVSSIGKKFKGISKLIKAAHKHNED